jgi:2-polyprenyl-3-methyl-5-hydroxy-6-metoxy-1,4-benzoquinol methylase
LEKPLIKKIADFVLLPLRVIMPPKKIRKIGLTPMIDERHNIVLEHVKGKLLDVGCGDNLLVKQYGDGIGVDVFPWKGIDILIHTPFMPFSEKKFDTVTFMASINHIPESIRIQVLREAKRVLKDDGQIIITMITPKISYLGHNFLWGWRDPDIQDRGMKEGEEWGFSPKQMIEILKKAGLKIESHKKFVYGLNHLYIVKK